jgi:hypothetical protein
MNTWNITLGEYACTAIENKKYVFSFDVSDFVQCVLRYYMYLRGPFENFVDSPYYSESELCGGAVTVSFSNNVSPRTFQTAFVVAPPS